MIHSEFREFSFSIQFAQILTITSCNSHSLRVPRRDCCNLNFIVGLVYFSVHFHTEKYKYFAHELLIPFIACCRPNQWMHKRAQRKHINFFYLVFPCDSFLIGISVKFPVCLHDNVPFSSNKLPQKLRHKSNQSFNKNSLSFCHRNHSIDFHLKFLV